MPVPPLPYLAWSRIIYYLSDSVDDLLKFSFISPMLQSVCRPYTSKHFRTISSSTPTLHSTAFPFHKLLQLILAGHVDPLFVHEFRYDWRTFSFPDFKPTPTARPGLEDVSEQRVKEYDHLFRTAATRVVSRDILDHVCQEFATGSQDAALATLLPLLGRIKVLEAPVAAGELCAAVFLDIADQYRRRSITGEQARAMAKAIANQDLLNKDPIRQRYARQQDTQNTLPFSELLILHTEEYDTWQGAPLEKVLPYFGIPSLHRIVLRCIRSHKYTGWPANVHCYCPEIYFSQSSVTKDMILAMVDDLNGPTDIKQWWIPDPQHWDSPQPQWDHVVIGRDQDGSKTVAVQLEYDGGGPGYDYGWVSWLYWQKMLDWTRLDEELLTQDGDEHDDFLGLCYV